MRVSCLLPSESSWARMKMRTDPTMSPRSSAPSPPWDDRDSGGVEPRVPSRSRKARLTGWSRAHLKQRGRRARRRRGRAPKRHDGHHGTEQHTKLRGRRNAVVPHGLRARHDVFMPAADRQPTHPGPNPGMGPAGPLVPPAPRRRRRAPRSAGRTGISDGRLRTFCPPARSVRLSGSCAPGRTTAP